MEDDQLLKMDHEAAWGGYGAFLLGGTNLINGGTFITRNAGVAKSNVDKSVVQAIPSIFSSNTVYTWINGDVEKN